MKRLILKIAAIGMLSAVLAGAGVFSAVCLCAHRERPVQEADCLIVLGAKVRADGRLSNSLRMRCVCALEAWKHGIAQDIIVCGGQGKDEPMTEAQAMRDFLSAQGVPDAQLHMESLSTDTRENLRGAAEIMRRRGWNTAAVVTNDYHVQRALWLARDAGVEACGIAAPSPNTPWGRFYARARESCSWVVYALRKVVGM